MKDFCAHLALDGLRHINIKKDDWILTAVQFETEFSNPVNNEVLKNTVVESIIQHMVTDEEALDIDSHESV